MKRLLGLLLILSACSSEPEHKVVPPFEERPISIQEKMKIALSENYLHQIGLPDSLTSYLYNYYESRNFEPVWVNDSMITATGEEIKEILLRPFAVGIPENRLLQGNRDNYIQDEINNTIGLALLFNDVKHGLINYETKTAQPRRLIDRDAFDTLAVFSDTISIQEQLIYHGPNDTTYRVLAKGLIDLVNTYPLDTSTFKIESIKYDTLMAFEKTRKALVSKGYLTNEIMDSLVINEALIKFQEENGLTPDGIIGKYTSMALNESTYRKMERIILAMDKIRATKERPDKYIRINIPEYKLRFYVNDSLKSDHNIVVGKTTSQTPELTSKLRKLVVYPYWNVPYSISSREILPAVKRNVGYLEKHNYKVFKKGVEIDPHTVNWKKIRRNAFPFKVRQEPGPSNSLGILKFDFYNEHSVYFHDTPSKSLFGVDVRAYSHGCMRTQNPVELGRIVLHYDSVSPYKYNEIRPDSLDSMLFRAEHLEIRLQTPIPIFVEYQTVARKDQKMVIHVDIYGRDEEYLELLRYD